jgi:hypothetical protein
MCLEMLDICSTIVSANTTLVGTLYRKRFIIVFPFFKMYITVFLFFFQVKNKSHDGIHKCAFIIELGVLKQ